MIAPRCAMITRIHIRYWKMTRRTLLVFAQLTASFIYEVETPARAVQANICEREMGLAAKRYDVPLAVLYAVGLTETGRRGSLQPFALNIEGPSNFTTTLNDALRQFEEAQKRGARLIDVIITFMAATFDPLRLCSIRMRMSIIQRVFSGS